MLRFHGFTFYVGFSITENMSRNKRHAKANGIQGHLDNTGGLV